MSVLLSIHSYDGTFFLKVLVRPVAGPENEGEYQNSGVL